MELELTDKVAVVTGASKGIGLAVTKAFAEEGANVVAGSRSPGEDITQLAERYRVLPVRVDLSTPEGPVELVQRAVEEFGDLDILVNNVGGADPRMGGFLSLSDEDWQRSLDLNLMSAVRTSRAALPHMLERGGGAIVNISSLNARLPLPAVTDYSAAKAALTNLSRELAEEFGPRGIRVNTVSPGPVLTPLWEGEGAGLDQLAQAMGTDRQGAMKAFVEQNGVTLGRFAEAEEVAALVLLLASDKAGFATGSDYLIDGGMLKSA